MGGSDETKFDHPTQKPVELMRRPILNHTKRGELVYEPFLGSGTTLAAAELTERVCCGMEQDAKYVDIIVQRWETTKRQESDPRGGWPHVRADHAETEEHEWRPGVARFVPQLAHVRAEAAAWTCGTTCHQKKKSLPRQRRAGGPGKNLMLMLLRVEPVGALASVGLERFDFVAGPFRGASDNPRTLCACQPIAFMIALMVAPFLRCSIANACAVLLPSRGAPDSGLAGFAALSPLGDFLAGVVFLLAFPFAGAPLPPLGAAGAVSTALAAYAVADSFSL
jgi:hypothetical protein